MMYEYTLGSMMTSQMCSYTCTCVRTYCSVTCSIIKEFYVIKYYLRHDIYCHEI